eukprot:CAMPEP_0119325344 /NCGR_PEP_ID=MMETSP1333-20130426/65565_1 /TAXON_ID=418940 /ORGANISM="Scyphosphaera apsteinii, Strain RCC1455" /LENGTH=319 /DNA_ID=CAMNT_0007333309 /DNA_START=157 /DNA_END=1116 /DNA_ORIENTATION=-
MHIFVALVLSVALAVPAHGLLFGAQQCAHGPQVAHSHKRCTLLKLVDGAGSNDDQETSPLEIDAFRQQLLRQFGDATSDGASSTMSSRETPEMAQVRVADGLAAGMVLIANPARFCSRNPFSRAVQDLNRFGLQGPVAGDDLSPDIKAQMLPVLVIIEHSSKGSRGLLLERRTGALMGDISMDDFGCVAISPLWLGGIERQNSLYVLHTCDGIASAERVRDNLWLGGWAEARPRVADSSVAESRFKFFLGATEWSKGQLEQEIANGAWFVLDCAPELVIKDRVMGMRPGKTKPVWTELVQLLGEPLKEYYAQVYSPGIE